jgi:hypothetical protein
MRVVGGHVCQSVFPEPEIECDTISGCVRPFRAPTELFPANSLFRVDTTNTGVIMSVNMRYMITVVETPPHGTARFVSSHSLDCENDNALKAALSDVCQNNVKITNSKKIVVLDVDEVEHNAYLEGVGKQPPRNGRFASPCEPGQTFNSALEASQHLGFNNNDVALYLGRVRRKFPNDSDASMRIAKVRGVTLIYDADHALSYRD